MAGKRRDKPRKKKTVYKFIVEGCTEVNYIKLLKLRYKKPAVFENCEGGSPKIIMEKAIKAVMEDKEDYAGYIVWFDNDTYDRKKHKDLKIHIENKYGCKVFITKPCMENWLKAHFEEVNLKDRVCHTLEKELADKKHLPNYQKDDCYALCNIITKEHIKRAIKNYPDIGKIPQDYFINQEV